jgi:type I restriction enzyme S subunit
MNKDDAKRPLPPGWRWARLEEVCEFKYGEGLPERQRLPGGVPVYGSNGIVGYHTASITDGAAVIVGRKGSIGEVHYSPVPCWPIDTTYYIDAAGTKTDCELPWLYSVLKWLQLDILNKATGVPGLNREDAYRQLLPLPPPDEQRRIAARLSEQMTVVERTRRAALAQVEATRALPASFIRQVFDWEEAKTWPRRKLRETCEKPQYGYTAASAREEVGPKFLRITDIQNGQVDWATVPYCQCPLDEEPKYVLRPGDLLFARSGATTGKSLLVQDAPARAVFASYLIRLRVGPTLRPEFAYLFFQSELYWQQVALGRRGGAQPNMNATLLGEVSLPLPPLEVQDRLVDRLGHHFVLSGKLRQRAEAQLEAVNALPGALLEEVFGGFEPPS